jgi:dihydrofolate synthase/folylpolyglutamate synthase
MVRHALATATLPGRLEPWRLRATLVIVDVAHNPAGAAFLAQLAAVRYPKRRFVVVLGMLSDKDASGVPEALGAMVSAWVCVPTRGPRGQSGAELAGRLRLAASLGLPASMVPQAPSVTVAETVTAGLERALAEAGSVDGILAFGSFSVVEDVRNVLLQVGAWRLSATDSARGPGLSDASVGG